MWSTFVLNALFFASAVSAADITVTVGFNGTLAFNPSNITADVGDNVLFQFASKNHTVTQSTFPAPCEPMNGGFDTGFQPVAAGAASLPQANITVTNATAPLWFFCEQMNPVIHCQQGMVFSINAPATGKTFAAFQAAAKASSGAAAGSNSTSSSSDTSGIGSTAAAVGGSAANTATSGAPAASTTPATQSGALQLNRQKAVSMTLVAAVMTAFFGIVV